MSAAGMDEEVDRRLLRAADFAAIGRHEQVIALASQVLADSPDEVQALLLLAGSLSMVERTSEAVHVARRAVALLPDDPQTLYMLGATLCDDAQHAEATTVLEAAIAADPDNADAFCALAMSAAQLERHQQAWAAANQALRLAPDDPDSHFAMGVALADWNPQQAANAYRQVLVLNPHHVEAQRNLAAISFLNDANEQGVREMAEVLAQRPGSQSALFMLDLAFIDVLGKAHNVITVTAFVALVVSVATGLSIGGDPLFTTLVGVAGVGLAARWVLPGLRLFAESLPNGARDFVRGLPRRQKLATVWLSCTGLAVVLLVIGPWLMPLLGPRPAMAAGLAWLLTLLGGSLSWLHLATINRRMAKLSG